MRIAIVFIATMILLSLALITLTGTALAGVTSREAPAVSLNVASDLRADLPFATSAASTAGTITWDSTADFAAGAASNTRVVNGSVQLERRWLAPVRVNSETSADQYQPAIAVDSNGVFYAVWFDNRNGNDIYAARSTDGGQTWSAGVRVNDESNWADRGAPVIAAGSPGKLYVAWRDSRNGHADIYFARSTDGGATWSVNRRINDDAGSAYQNEPTIQASADDKVYLAWRDDRNGHPDIYFASATSDGLVWSANRKVNNDTTSASQYGPNLALDGSGKLYLAWTDDRNGNSDIYFSSSADSGSTWASNVRVVDDVSGYAQSNPSLAVDGSGKLYLVWQDSREWPSALYLATSTDAGATWSPNRRVGPDPSSQPSAPSLAASTAGILHLGWVSTNDTQVYCASSSNSGVTWSQARNLSHGMASTPRVLVDSSGTPAAIWTEYDPFNEGIANDIYFASRNSPDYESSGAYSIIHNTGDLVRWNTLTWVSTTPAGASVALAVRVGNTATPDLHWTDWMTLTASPASLSALPPSQYLQWRAVLATTNSSVTPSLDRVSLAWDAFAYTPKSGVVGASATWPTSGSPYVISGTLAIAPNRVLTLEPGVELWFRDQARLQVRGGLVALGGPTQPITLTSWHANKRPGDWYGVVFESTALPSSFDNAGAYVSGSALQNVVVEYGGGYGSRYAVDAAEVALYVHRSTIRNNSSGGLRSRGGVVANNLIASNAITLTAEMNGIGIANDGGARIEGNTVRDNLAADYNPWNGRVVRGVGIYSSGGGQVKNNIVRGNRARNVYISYGAGIFASGGVVTGNTVQENVQDEPGYGYGSGIYAESSQVTGNTVVSNTVTAYYNAHGGGVHSVYGAVRDNTVAGNVARGRNSEARGGGIYQLYNGTVEANRVQGNRAASDNPSAWAAGGGVYVTDGAIAVRNNEIRNNQAHQGGGVYVNNGILSDNQILDNRATVEAGAVWWVGSQEMSYNTLTGNTSAGATGGIYLYNGYPRIFANRIEGNSGYALYNNNAYVNINTVVDARGNWWGPIDEATIPDLIYDYDDPPYEKGPVDASEPAGPQRVDLAVNQSIAAVVPAVGRPLTYTVTVRNLSAGKASAVQVRERVPVTASVRSATPSQGSCSLDSAGQMLCALGTVAANGTATITFVVEPQAPGALAHGVSARSTEPDTDESNNGASREDMVYVAPGGATVTGPTVGLYGASHTFTATVRRDTGVQAAFVGVDNVTQGNWGGVYGRDGYVLPYWDYGSWRQRWPVYVSNISYQNMFFGGGDSWSWDTTDIRALPGQEDNGGRRSATCGYNDWSFDINIDVSDSAIHDLAFYILDWDNLNRQQRIELLDPATETVLATSGVQDGFRNGRYVRFQFRGDIKVRFTRSGNMNVVMSGIFFDTDPAAGYAPTLPLTYTWQAAGQTAVTHVVNDLNPDRVTWAWQQWGRQPVTVTVSNVAGSVTAYHAIDILTPPSAVSISGPNEGLTGLPYTFSASVSPITATTPITYVWEVAGGSYGTLLYMPLNEALGATIFNDYSGQNHHGTCADTACPTSTTDGIRTAMQFDGINDYIEVGLDIPETGATIQIRFRTTCTSCGLFSVDQGPLANGDHDRHIYLRDGNLCTRIWSDETTCTSGQNYADNQWHEVIFTYGHDITGHRIYVDGELKATGNKATSDFGWQDGINIGFSNDGNQRFFAGLIDEVVIYDHVFNAGTTRRVLRSGGITDLLTTMWSVSGTHTITVTAQSPLGSAQATHAFLARERQTVIGPVYDAGNLVRWASLPVTSTLPAGSTYTVSVRVGNSPTPDRHWSEWTALAAGTAPSLTALPVARYLQWQVDGASEVPLAAHVQVGRPAHTAFAYTLVTEAIESNTAWTQAGAPYVVRGGIQVREGVTLTVEPGTTVWFQDGGRLRVAGGLIALGSATQPITFTSWHVRPQPGDWSGLTFDDTAVDATFRADGSYLSGSALRYATVQYGGYNAPYAVDAPSSALYVDHCTVVNNSAGGVRSAGGVLSYNLIADNALLVTQDVNGVGIAGSGGTTIHGNTVRNNRASASSWSYRVLGVGIYSIGAGRVTENLVQGNVARSLNTAQGGGIYAEGGVVADNEVRENLQEQLYYGHGGGIYARDAQVTGNVVVSNTITTVHSAMGGGIHNAAGTVQRNVVRGNMVQGQWGHASGGGIYHINGGLVAENEVVNNRATMPDVSSWAAGGGIYFSDGAGVVRDNRIEGNTANQGGGVYDSGGVLVGNRIIGNHAANNVGGVYWANTSSVELLHNTITGNTTAGNVGGVYVTNSYPRLQYNALVGNGGAYALYVDTPYGGTGNAIDARYNWWGTTSATAIKGLIFDYNDDTNKALVNTANPLSSGAATVVGSALVQAPVSGAGQAVTLTLFLENRSPSVAERVAVTATLPVSLSYVAGSGPAGASYTEAARTLTWRGSVGAGQSLPLSWRMVVAPTAPLLAQLPVVVQLSGDGISEVAVLTPTVTVGQVVYANDFQVAAGPAWNYAGSVTTAPNGERFLGRFTNETVQLNLDRLPRHVTATVSFDLYVIQSWDGNCGPDVWELNVGGGPTLLRTTFANWLECRQAYPDGHPGGDRVRQSRAVAVDSLGYGQLSWGDAVYRLSYSFPHTATQLSLNFAGSNLEWVENESWGLDNVQVSVLPADGQGVDLAVSQTAAATPAPAVGRPLTYTVIVRNRGASEATFVTVEDTLPPTVTVRTAAATQGSCGVIAVGQTRCEVGTLGGGATATVTLVTEPQAPGVVVHQAQVRSAELDANPADNTAVRSDTVYVAPGGAVISGPVVGLYGASHTFTATVRGEAGSAAFLGVDNAPRGNWGGVYGRDGYELPYWDYGTWRRSWPAYLSNITYENVNWSAWAWNTSDVRALPGQADNSGPRHAPFGYNGSWFDINLWVNDTAAHEVAFYILDWDNTQVRQRIELLDPLTGAVLASSGEQTGFRDGRYVRFQYRGNVKVRFTHLGNWNAVVSGIFFDTDPAAGYAPTLPLTYTWQAAGQTPVTHVVNDLNPDRVTWAWQQWGRQPLTVTVSNVAGSATAYHAIDILTPPSGVSISGPSAGLTGELYVYTATVTPVTATVPLTYIWEFSPGGGLGDAEWQASYWNNTERSGEPAVRRTERAIDFDWSWWGSPDPAISSDNFSARWERLIFVPQTAAYRFQTQSDDWMRVQVDGFTISEGNWNTDVTYSLSAGLHRLVVEFIEYGGYARAYFSYGRSDGTPDGQMGRRVVLVGGLTSVLTTTWSISGTQTITVTVQSPLGSARATHSFVARERQSLLGSVYDAKDIVRWQNLTWSTTLPAGSPYTVKVRVGNSPTPDEHWSDWAVLAERVQTLNDNASLADLPPTRYLQWQVTGASTVDLASHIQMGTPTYQPFAYTRAPQRITTNTTWTRSNSPYLVTSQVLVATGATLTIEPGVVVLFTGPHVFLVEGTLVARGTEQQPITFTSWHVRGQPGDWGFIVFEETAPDASFDNDFNYISGSALQHVIVEYAGGKVVSGFRVLYDYPSLAYTIDAVNTSIYVDHAVIRRNRAGGVRSDGGVLTNNTVVSNTLTLDRDMNGFGISSASSALIAGNTIANNQLSASSRNYTLRGLGIYAGASGHVANNRVQANRATNFNVVFGGGIYAAPTALVEGNRVIANRIEQVSYAYGGGIWLDSGRAVSNTVQDNYIATDWENRGGGIHSSNSTVEDNVVTGNRLNSNWSPSYGGGVYSSNSFVRNNIVTGNQQTSYNSQSYGGGIYSEAFGWQEWIDGHLVIRWNGGQVDGNTVTGNQSAGYGARGGGVYATGYFSVTNNTVHDNQVAHLRSDDNNSEARGGGLYAAGAGGENCGDISGLVDNNEIVGNRALGPRGSGGGAYLASTTLQNSLVLSNTAEGNYGGVWWRCGGALTHTRVEGNNAAGSTGGVFVDGRPVINHNTFLNNSGYALDTTSQQNNPRLNARYNWWGVVEEEAIDGLIYDFFDNPQRGFVNYTPYLLEPPRRGPVGGTVTGRTAGLVGATYRFDVNIYPVSVIKPITFVWTSAGQQFTHTVNLLADSAAFSWSTPGLKTITVSASNAEGSTVITHTIEIAQASANDDYEPNNVCTQAGTISTDGATQFHTINSATDEDWVRFDVVAGAKYVVEATTPDDSYANMKVEVFSACSGSTVQVDDNSFGPDVSLTFNAPATGSIYLRLTDEGGAVSRGLPASYYLSVRRLGTTPQPGAVILVAGKLKEGDSVQPNIYKVIEDAYKMFLANGYTSDRIYYLAPDTSRTNPAEDIFVDEVSSRAALQNAITVWARSKLGPDQPLTIYLMDHGDHDVFYLNLLNNRLETVEPRELNEWLSELEAAVPGVKVNVIIEACRSGSFITAGDLAQTVSKPNRVVIASTGAWPLAYASPTGGAMFSDAFIAALQRGNSLNSSFAEARWTVEGAYPSQTPWLDDNGNSIPNEREDGQIAAMRGFAYAGTFADVPWPPRIVSAYYDPGTGQIRARVEAQVAVRRVWARIYSPSYVPPTDSEELVVENVPEVELSSQGAGLYTGIYSNFTEPGEYRVVIYVVDNRNLLARPMDATKGNEEEPTPTNTPSPLPTPTNTPSSIPTPTNTPSSIPTPTNTPSPLPTPTNTPSSTPSSTSTPTDTPAPSTPTDTPYPPLPFRLYLPQILREASAASPTATLTPIPSTPTHTPTSQPAPTSFPYRLYLPVIRQGI